MMQHLRMVAAVAMMWSVAAAGIAQAQTPAAGHWEGAIAIPGQELKVAVDLKADAGKWQGTIDIPAQKLKGFPLANIAATGDAISFVMPNVPGEPSFKGTVAKDGKTMAGDFSQGGGTVPFTLTRTGEARFEPAPRSTPITANLLGAWAGTLDVQGKTLRLTVTFTTAADGTGTGTLVSVDQGNASIPVAAVVQNGAAVKFFVPSVVGTFEGTLKGGELAGTWTQGPGSLPLVFKRTK
jgi:hypothetical protein